MTTGPRFVVAICAYNHERFIDEAVDSVLAQTYPPERIIAFSDGSKDRSLERLRARLEGDPRVVWLDDMETNKGFVARLRETDKHLLPGGYVALLAADDVFLPNALEVHARHFARGAEWSIAASDFTDEKLVPRWRADPERDLAKVRRPLFEAILSGDVFLFPHGWSFSTELLRRAGGYNSRWFIEDLPLMLRFAQLTTPMVTGECVRLNRELLTSVSRDASSLAPVVRDHAQIALSYLREAPLTALRTASKYYALAAYSSVKGGRLREGAVDAVKSVALFPFPLAKHHREGATKFAAILGGKLRRSR